jgi:acyl-coenzyme A synthetase/AMP-(fatty) acid ligase
LEKEVSILKKLYNMIPDLEFITGHKSDGSGLPAAGCPCPTCVIEGSLGSPEEGDMVVHTPFEDEGLSVKFGTVENVEVKREQVLVPQWVETATVRVRWDDGNITIHGREDDLTVIKRTNK